MYTISVPAMSYSINNLDEWQVDLITRVGINMCHFPSEGKTF
jgi:hypothetical protein